MNQLFKRNEGTSSSDVMNTDLLLDLSQLNSLDWLKSDAFSFSQQENSWLTDTRSLTQKLHQITQTFQITLLSDGWLRQEGRNTSIRQVILGEPERPLVIGITEVENSSLSQEEKLFHWKDRPLGELLFEGKSAVDRIFEITDLSQSSYFCDWLAKWYDGEVQQPIWARRSTVYFQTVPLALIEIFLPKHPIYGVSS